MQGAAEVAGAGHKCAIGHGVHDHWPTRRPLCVFMPTASWCVLGQLCSRLRTPKCHPGPDAIDRLIRNPAAVRDLNAEPWIPLRTIWVSQADLATGPLHRRGSGSLVEGFLARTPAHHSPLVAVGDAVMPRLPPAPAYTRQLPGRGVLD